VSWPALLARLLDSHPHIYLGPMGLSPRCRLLGLVAKNVCVFCFLITPIWPLVLGIFNLIYCRNSSLGLVTKARGCKVAGQVRDPGAFHMLPGVQRMWRNEPSHSQVNSHVGSWSPERTPESSERNCRGQISLSQRVLYIIGKFLKCRCPKWPCMSHLDICRTSYGQKKGRESNWQFDSRPLKVGNRPDLLGCRQRATYRWKFLDERYNFASDRIAIGGLQKKLCAFKVPGVLDGGISVLPRGSPGKEKPFGCRPRGESQSIL
jgi:hypothetical protein